MNDNLIKYKAIDQTGKEIDVWVNANDWVPVHLDILPDFEPAINFYFPFKTGKKV